MSDRQGSNPYPYVSQLHVHLVLGRRDGTAWAGHLVEGRVRPTLEVIVTEAPAHLRKQADPETGLSFIRPRQMG